MSGPQGKVIHFCNFPVLNTEAVLADFFSMVSCGRFKADESPLTKLLEADYGVLRVTSALKSFLLFLKEII